MSKIGYDIAEIVYLKTDSEKLPRIITRYTVSRGAITYELMCGPNLSWHYDFEFTRNFDELSPKKEVGLGKS